MNSDHLQNENPVDRHAKTDDSVKQHLAVEQDRYLRLAADFHNYKKPTASRLAMSVGRGSMENTHEFGKDATRYLFSIRRKEQ